jgi:hypothetical protein
MANTVIGLFEDIEAAQRAVEDLTRAGFTHDDIRILDREKIQAAPGILDDFRHSGVPDDDTGIYAEGINRGGVLISVTAEDDRVEEARDLVEQHRPADLAERATEYQTSGFMEDPEASQAHGTPLTPGYEQSYIPRAPGGIGDSNTPSYTENYPAGDNVIGMPHPAHIANNPANGMDNRFASPSSRIPVSSESADADVIAVSVAPMHPATRQADTDANIAPENRPAVDSMTGNLETAQDRINREGAEAHRSRIGGPVDAGDNAYSNGNRHHTRVYSPLRN